MSQKPKSDGIHVKGDVSGVIVYGNGNRVTASGADAPRPEGKTLPHQQNSAEDHGNVYAVTRGTMNVTVNHYDDQDDAVSPDPESGSEL